MKIVVIIPAAGLGTRMASSPSPKAGKPAASKQFIDLQGKPVLIHTLKKIAGNPEIAEIFVALRKTEISSFRQRLEREAPEVFRKKTVLLEGGEHRQQSVSNALAAVAASADDVVLVHDAVHPLSTDELKIGRAHL